jgi:GNAT superfamily N-acetyltransferase
MAAMEADFLPPDSELEIVTAAERPDLWEMGRSLFGDVWPEYNNHGNHTGRIFSSLIPQHARFQVLVSDRTLDRPVARGRTIPIGWDGSLEDLPMSFDALGPRAEEGRPLDTLSALAAEVRADQQGRGLSRVVIQAMAACARAAGFTRLVAPVRPNWKDRYPIIPIEDYAHWTRDDGSPFDPWLRVHHALGATIVRVEPASLQIEAPVADWETWTGMAFPADGEYVFPRGLAPLAVHGGTGSYWEPNVWMLHQL